MKKSTSTANWGPRLFWLGLLLLWQAGPWIPGFPKALVPTPLSIFQALGKDAALVARHLGSTLGITFFGLSLGILAGLAAALGVDRFPRLKPYLWPFLTLSQTLPPFLIYPLLLLALGFGHAPRVIIAALVCFFPVAVSFAQGLGGTDPDRSELFRSLGARPWATWIYLRIPSGLPSLAAGLRVSAAYSVVGVVFGEMMGGPMEGIGFYMIRKLDNFQPGAVYGAVALVSLITLGIIRLFEAWEDRLLNPGIKMKSNHERKE